jgi:hypothetical protein
LLYGATDADHDTLTVVEPISTPAHGTAQLDTEGVKYTPGDYTGPDSFTYTISDGNGGTAVGTVDVTVSAGDGASPNVVVPPSIGTDGKFHVTFAGIPNYYYQVQTATGNGPSYSWTDLGAKIQAGPNGLFEFIDTINPGSGLRVYRTTGGSPTP